MILGIFEAFVKELDLVKWDPEPYHWLGQVWVPKPWRWFESGGDSKHFLMRRQELVVSETMEAVEAEWDSKPSYKQLI